MEKNNVVFLENLQITISENDKNMTMKEFLEYYEDDFVPPYFVQNYGRKYPFSWYWVNLLIQLDELAGLRISELKEKSKNAPQGESRTFKNRERRYDKMLLKQILREENKNV